MSQSTLHRDPRPVHERVVQLERTRERATFHRPLPGPLLYLAQRTGTHPWLVPAVSVLVGVLAALVQGRSPVLPLALLGGLGLLALGVVVVAAVVRRRVRTGVPLRPREVVVDSDQAIPAAALAPVAALVAWMFTTLMA